MARKRLRRLVTRLKWVWVPIVASVLVVSVAMVCAVWSPVPDDRTEFGHGFSGDDTKVPRALRQYDGEYTGGDARIGLGVSFYLVATQKPTVYPDGGVEQEFEFTVGRAGLPFRCMRWTDDRSDDSGESSLWAHGIETKQTFSGLRRPRRIPLMPEPVGLFLNILIVSTAIVLVRAGVRRAVVYRRRRENLCVNCAYPVDDFAVCPECGTPTEREE